MSFNLGGLFGVFFTRGIRETAKFIDIKIRRQINRHNFKKVHIVGHSKGGLVALWWLLKLGGNKYCDNVITMGSPFSGSIYTYLALMTPLGFIWRDVWQMRPGSEFLRDLHGLKFPRNVKVYCLYSEKDRVANGENALFKTPFGQSQIVPIPMNHISHFEFLYRRDVGDAIAAILKKSDAENGEEPISEETTSA
jgi:pimeloyl-ACP methyl ester carboxylesterase